MQKSINIHADNTSFDVNVAYNVNVTSGYSQKATWEKMTSSAEKTVANNLWLFGGPIVFFVGITGNLLIVCVMSRLSLRGTTTSFYLRLLAGADMCVILTGILPDWLESTGSVTFKKLSPTTCQLEKFLFYTVADTSICILVAFTVDRFIAVIFPLRKKSMCLPKRTPLYCLGTLVLAIFKNAHVFWTRGAEYKFSAGNNSSTAVLLTNCGSPASEYKRFESYTRPWIAFVSVNVIPFMVILVCNTFIIRALTDVKRMRVVADATATKNCEKSLVQTTIMGLSASFSFLVCVTPSIVLLIGKPYWATTSAPGGGTKSNFAYSVSKSINNLLFFLNHSMNFFLYCLTGRRFRRELVNMLTRRRQWDWRDSAGVDYRTSTTYRPNVIGNLVLQRGSVQSRIYGSCREDQLNGSYRRNNGRPNSLMASNSSTPVMARANGKLILRANADVLCADKVVK